MAIKTEKSVLYHIPKCGGVYAKEAVRRGMRDPQIHYGRCSSNGHRNDYGLYREHAIPNGVLEEDKRGRLSICFVRHPVTWYKSYWCYRVKSGFLDKKFPLDNIWDDNYEKFIEKVLREHPDGFVGKLYQQYVGRDLQGINFIGKQEQLVDDLVEALTLAGETFNELRLRKTKWHNLSAKYPQFGDQAVLSTKLENRIIEMEEWLMENFYV